MFRIIKGLPAKVVARESVVVASEFVVVAVIVVVVAAVVVVVSVVVAAVVVDEHGDDGQEECDDDEESVHEPKVRGNGKADDELPHLQVSLEDLPKIGSRALHTKLHQFKVNHQPRVL